MSVDTDIWILSACGYFSPKANSRGVINRRKPHYPQNMWITTLYLWTSLFTVWGELCGLPHFVPIKLDMTRLFRFTHLWTESIFIEGHGITPRVINTQNHPVSGVFRSLCTFPHPQSTVLWISLWILEVSQNPWSSRIKFIRIRQNRE